jgi:hypothetical protein
MAIHYRTEYPATPERVLSILTDSDFLREHAAELQVLSHEAELQEKNGVWSIYLRLVAPTKDIAAIFRPFVGSEIVMHARREWIADGNGGYGSKLHIEASVKGRPVSVTGSLSLKPTAIGTEFVAEWKTTVSVRFIGGLVRDAIDDLVKESFEDETIVMRRWLAANRK